MKNSNIRKYVIRFRPNTNVKYDVEVHATTYDKETPTDDPT